MLDIEYRIYLTFHNLSETTFNDIFFFSGTPRFSKFLQLFTTFGMQKGDSVYIFLKVFQERANLEKKSAVLRFMKYTMRK